MLILVLSGSFNAIWAA